ncbi:MAG: peptidyl-prolyl cis-trans isomerase [Acidobacteria bacterium]|nr:peptidyl-prolyl cis-trans isomerase [Acidobacteriota bacterium]
MKLKGTIAGLALLVGLVAAPARPRADILEQIVVKVNGDIITKTEFEARQVAALRQRNQQFNNDETLRKAIADITPQLIVEAVDELLLIQKGRETGLKMTDDQFKNIVENIKKENKIETEEQFQAALKQEGMTLEDLRKAIERNMLVSRVQQADILGKIQVTEEEERQYYMAHQKEFETPAEITLREILVAVPADTRGVNVAVEEDARQRVEEVRKRAVAGESFEKLVADVSEAPSKANGGLIGPIRRSELAGGLRDELEKLQAGELSSPIRTDKGYVVLKVEQQTKAAPMPFEQARQEIADRLFDQRRREELKRYLKKLRAEAVIEWKNAELKKAYDQYLAANGEAP